MESLHQASSRHMGIVITSPLDTVGALRNQPGQEVEYSPEVSRPAGPQKKAALATAFRPPCALPARISPNNTLAKFAIAAGIPALSSSPALP